MLSVILAGALALAVPQQQVDTTIAVRPNGRLVVDTYSGPVIVRSWSRNDVRVQATHSRGAEVEVDYRGNTLSIDASPAQTGRDAIGITVSVPRSFAVSIDGVDVNTTVDGIDAGVSVDIVNGSVTVRNVKGDVSVDAVSARMIIENVRGDVNASGSNEGIHLSGITGDINAETVNGPINITGAVSSNVSAETVNGSILLGTTIRDGGRYAASTTNGSITVTLQEGANATIDVSTFSGSVNSRIPNLTADRRRGGSFTLRTGSGSAKIDLEAFSGTIELVRPGDVKTGSR
ncbi:MAG TPA: DUF4097 family beta strand repeat-containing protein [Longimicrobiales bacterium]